jgi:hypothetical protein
VKRFGARLGGHVGRGWDRIAASRLSEPKG